MDIIGGEPAVPTKRGRLVVVSLIGMLIGIMCGLAGVLAIVLTRLAHVAVTIGR